MSIIVVGCGSGLGKEIFNYLKKSKKKFLVFQAKGQKNLDT
jgi:hypothetical protein